MAAERDTAVAGNPRILVVDDDAQVLGVLSTVLRSVGYQVVAAESGEAAVNLARELTFDLALCDRRMPGMDGIELFERLREIQPMCARVLLTGGLDLATTVNAVNRGAVTRVLEKPIRSEALRRVVADSLDARRQMVRAYENLQQESLLGERGVLTDVLASDHIQIAVQPMLNAADLSVFGHEALLRSTHAELNGPASILAAVERHELVDELAEVVLARSLRFLEQTPDSKLFINVHPAELGDPEALDERLIRLQAHASRVILEITERSSIYGLAWERSLDVIKNRGFEVAVDDLGAGYSALAVLAELNPRYIKVDMTIIRDCDRQSHKRRLIELLCKFGETCEAMVVAEGIETQAEADTVRSCGAHLLQGYFFGRPKLFRPLRVVDEGEDSAGKSDAVSA